MVDSPYLEVRGAATEASASHNDTPTMDDFNAAISFAPSPQKADVCKERSIQRPTLHHSHILDFQETHTCVIRFHFLDCITLVMSSDTFSESVYHHGFIIRFHSSKYGGLPTNV
jgi:hypothetical protein